MFPNQKLNRRMVEKLPSHPLRRWRKAQSLTLKDASARIGLSKSALSKIENGRVPSPKAMPLICKATWLSPNDFYPISEAAE